MFTLASLSASLNKHKDKDNIAYSAIQSKLPSFDEICAHHLIDENRLLGGLIERAVFTEDERHHVSEIARRLVLEARNDQKHHGGVDAFMREYGLSTEEGVILMCLAEALLRIPDAETADAFIAEKIRDGNWERHRGHSDSFFVNASTWGLMLTGRLVKLKETSSNSFGFENLKRFVARSGEPIVRQAVRQAVKLLGEQFVLGRTIEEAILRGTEFERKGYRLSYDMLGEAAKTETDAQRYLERYRNAIISVGQSVSPPLVGINEELLLRPSISIKLSALHPRFDFGRDEQLINELLPRINSLINEARACGLSLTIDAEEQDKLEIMLRIFGEAFLNPELKNWKGLGIAVQAYGRRSIPVLRWLKRLSEVSGKSIPVRLVKGAYWDSEIKWAQEKGLLDYPVFTRKRNTDVSYLACMRYMLSYPRYFYCQFASHNAHTIASAILAAGNIPFEFQRLHGMGEPIYDNIISSSTLSKPCRIYAPVGDHEYLLSYLVRRLLENGSNTSFVNRLADDETPVTKIIQDPLVEAENELSVGEDKKNISRPRDIFWPDRRNSKGLALDNSLERTALTEEMRNSLSNLHHAGPIISGRVKLDGQQARIIHSPHNLNEKIGSIRFTQLKEIDLALQAASKAAHNWDQLGGARRAKILDTASDFIERDRSRLMALLVREAGKTIPNALSEVREAVDYLRYYAFQARRLFSEPTNLKGPTGETNTLNLNGRGVFLCISPWNFPLAIFIGQIAAALAAGNSVVAKPAEQTPLIAFLATRLLHEAGVPADVLHFLPGGSEIGAALVLDKRIQGVAFTGSNETAWAIQKSISDRRSAIIPFIAETGGINAMIADSSALPEQVVRDVMRSAFDSAGQRCSSARVLFLQNEIANKTIEMITGAVSCLQIGDPLLLSTDIGPVIDDVSKEVLESHKLRMKLNTRELIDMPIPFSCQVGTYVSPACYEIERFDILEREVFGPVLHIIRYPRDRLADVITSINASGFGLTLGLHSRIQGVADYVSQNVKVGNFYINRSQVGAIPGVQPFGGEGLSGSGPKAGGPNYIQRFGTERVCSTDITVTGGNIQLLTLSIKDEY